MCSVYLPPFEYLYTIIIRIKVEKTSIIFGNVCHPHLMIKLFLPVSHVFIHYTDVEYRNVVTRVFPVHILLSYEQRQLSVYCVILL